jgi:hypothetical protein
MTLLAFLLRLQTSHSKPGISQSSRIHIHS